MIQPVMPNPSAARRSELARLRKARQRLRRKASGFVEIHAVVPSALAAELEISAALIPGATKDALVRDILKAHLPKPVPESARLIQHIFESWGQIEVYKNYPPGKMRPGPPVPVKGRLYHYEDSVRLHELRFRIERWLKDRGVEDPFAFASALYRLAPKAK